MHISFNRTNTLEILAPMMCAVSKTAIPATEGILIEATEEGLCHLTAYDTEKGVKRDLEADVKEPGSYIISAQKFMQTLRVMDGDEVELTVDGKLIACFSSGKSSHKIAAKKGEEFPSLPILLNDRGFEIGQAALKKMLSKVSFAMGVNDQRTVLNGAFFRIKENSLHLVSCDSFRLARCTETTPVENRSTREGDAETMPEFRFIVPVKTVNELQRLLSDGEEENITILVSRKFISFRFPNLLFFSRLVEGEYIDYDRIILRNHRITATVDKNALISALERASLVTEERIAGSVRSHVKLHFSGDYLYISAQSAMGSTYDELRIGHEGDDLVIAFNNRFLLDSVRACDAKNLKLSLSSAISSINVEPAEEQEDGDQLFMLLPVRIKE